MGKIIFAIKKDYNTWGRRDVKMISATAEMNPLLEQLKYGTLYAQRSFSTKLLYQTYGKATGSPNTIRVHGD